MASIGDVNKNIDIDNYKKNLPIASDAYSAVDGANQQQSSEWFYFEPVGIYDTKDGKWIEIDPNADLTDPETLEYYLEGNPDEWAERYSVACGIDMDNIDGYMNMDDFIKEYGIDIDNIEDGETSPQEVETPTTTDIQEEIVNNQQLSEDLAAIASNMQPGETKDIIFNGHNATIKKTIPEAGYEYDYYIKYQIDENNYAYYYYDENYSLMITNIADYTDHNNIINTLYDPEGDIIVAEKDLNIQSNQNLNEYITDEEINNMNYDEWTNIKFDDHVALIKKNSEDDSITIYYVDSNGSQINYTYDAEGNLEFIDIINKNNYQVRFNSVGKFRIKTD